MMMRRRKEEGRLDGRKKGEQKRWWEGCRTRTLLKADCVQTDTVTQPELIHKHIPEICTNWRMARGRTISEAKAEREWSRSRKQKQTITMKMKQNAEISARLEESWRTCVWQEKSMKKVARYKWQRTSWNQNICSFHSMFTIPDKVKVMNLIVFR